MEKTIKHLPFSDWLFLYYLAKNIHEIMFDVIKQVSLEIEQKNKKIEANNFDDQNVDEIDEPSSAEEPLMPDSSSGSNNV
jgi:hypothetical protein